MKRRASQEPQLDLVRKLAEWAIVGLGALITAFISQGVAHIQKLTDSVATLNQNIVVIIERLGTHDKKLERHESEIEDLKRAAK